MSPKRRPQKAMQAANSARVSMVSPDTWSKGLSRGKADKVSLQFLTKLQQLVSSGLPLGDAIKAMANRISEPKLKGLAHAVWKGLSEGGTLSSAMRSQGRIFDPSLAAMVEAGEATGNLKPILSNINELLEARIRMRKEIAAGLSYPAFILFIVVMVLLFVLFYLMPRVENMMDSMGGELTLSAKLVMTFAEWSLFLGPIAIVVGLLAAIGIQQWRRYPEGQSATDNWLLRIPVVRDITLNAELGRLSNLAAILISSGVDTTDALRLMERGIRNSEIQRRFRASRALISDGASFSASFQRNELLSDMDLDILSISENTGNLATGFSSIHHNRHEMLREQMKRLTVVISTGALLFVFALVFLLVFGIVSSILQLSQSVLAGT